MSYEARPADPINRKKQRFDVIQTGDVNGNRAPRGERDYDEPRDTQQARPRFERPSKPRKPAQRRERPSAFSHDDLIASWKGKKIAYLIVGGSVAQATLVDADKYAILIQWPSGSRQLIFKHALTWVQEIAE